MEPDTRFDALVDFMLTVAYVDGVLDQREADLLNWYLDQLLQYTEGGQAATEMQRGHFESVYKRLEAEIGGLASEAHANNDTNFVASHLKVRALALFKEFPPSDQQIAMELAKAIVAADGTVSPSEQALHDGLMAYLQAPPPTMTFAAAPPPSEQLQIQDTATNGLSELSHPLLDPLEEPLAYDDAIRQRQIGADYQLMFEAISVWERQRARGNGKLAGITDISQLPMGTRLLDGHVHVLRPEQTTELIVIGDLHGCYACLKAAILQSELAERIKHYQEDPANNPDIKLVLLGDYLDRGRYGFEVLRAALKLLVTYPNHVILLRGNHEHLIRVGERVISTVSPAESVPRLTPVVSTDILEAYRHLFEHMPTSLIFDRTLFVHGGIPRDDTFAQRYRDLASLDDPTIRFEMMWSDPIDTDHVPLELQHESTRFSFGRNQFHAFMEKIGCNALIRGHEQIDTGFAAAFAGSVDGRQLYTLFSAGGRDNNDLPAESRYRNVTPMALTIRRDHDFICATPWPIEYEQLDDAENNGLYRAAK